MSLQKSPDGNSTHCSDQNSPLDNGTLIIKLSEVTANYVAKIHVLKF